MLLIQEWLIMENLTKIKIFLTHYRYSCSAWWEESKYVKISKFWRLLKKPKNFAKSQSEQLKNIFSYYQIHIEHNRFMLQTNRIKSYASSMECNKLNSDRFRSDQEWAVL